ncbi:UNVERIFIED_CONTAM: ribosomal protein S18 acetylase RimI-like enzyme [Brevibacillus sp. OAP136]
MELTIIHSKQEVRQYLQTKEVANFMYHCCNLEEDYWSYSQFYGLSDKGELLAVAIMTVKYGMPVLLASTYCEQNHYQDMLLGKLAPYLPEGLYSHLNPGAFEALGRSDCKSRTIFHNMRLERNEYSPAERSEEMVRLTLADKERLLAFYQKSHPDYLLDDGYLEKGQYVGIVENGELVSAAGIFSASDEYDVVQIGNVATHPDTRGRGLAAKVITQLIDDMLPIHRHIVLNVKEENRGAIRLYSKLGFRKIGLFEEVIF